MDLRGGSINGRGTPKSSILNYFDRISIINHRGIPIDGDPHMDCHGFIRIYMSESGDHHPTYS